MPGSLDSGTDLLSRGEPCCSDWSLHLRVVDQIWSRFWRSDVDLFCIGDGHEVFGALLLDRAGPSGVDAPGARLAEGPPLCLSTVGVDTSDVGEGQAPKHDSPTGCSSMGLVEVRGDDSSPRLLMAPPTVQRPSTAGTGLDF